MSLLQTEDTFKTWRDKINGAFDAPVYSAFEYVSSESTGLDVVIQAGVFRDGTYYTTIIKTTVSLDPNSTQVICIDPRTVGSELITKFNSGSIPSYCIPLHECTTNTNSLTAITDLRGWGQENTKAEKLSAIMFADTSIAKNVTIGAGETAFSVNPTVESGYTVTVETGGLWVVV